MAYRNIVATGVVPFSSLASQSVLAQGSVAIYGMVDTGVTYNTNANAAGNTVLKVPSLTGELPSRIGFRATEAMGQGKRLLGR